MDQMTWIDEMTDAVLYQDRNRSKYYDADTEQLMPVVQRLHDTLQWQSPSDEFVSSVKKQLLDEPSGMLARVRALPGRVHIAAGLTVGAGFALLIRRRIWGGDMAGADLPILQQ